MSEKFLTQPQAIILKQIRTDMRIWKSQVKKMMYMTEGACQFSPVANQSGVNLTSTSQEDKPFALYISGFYVS